MGLNNGYDHKLINNVGHIDNYIAFNDIGFGCEPSDYIIPTTFHTVDFKIQFDNKEFIINNQYNCVDIFNNEMSFVDFVSSTIESTDFNKIGINNSCFMNTLCDKLNFNGNISNNEEFDSSGLIDQTTFIDTVFNENTFNKIKFKKCYFKNVIFDHVIFDETCFWDCRFKNVIFRQSIMTNSMFKGCVLTNITQFGLVTDKVQFLWCSEGNNDKFRDFNISSITRE